MKRISMLLAVLALGFLPNTRAQDAATEERLNKLSGQIEDLRAGQEALRKQLDSILRDVSSLREQAAKPTANYASPEDLKGLRDALKEEDRKRLEDYDKIRSELLNLRNSLLKAPPPAPHKTTLASNTTSINDSDKPAKPEKGYEYEIKSGDTLSTIVQAYRDNNVKITTDQILKANPGLKAEKLRVGQKIWIPAPQS